MSILLWTSLIITVTRFRDDYHFSTLNYYDPYISGENTYDKI